MEKADKGDEKYKDLKGNKKKKNTEDLKKELDLVSGFRLLHTSLLSCPGTEPIG